MSTSLPLSELSLGPSASVSRPRARGHVQGERPAATEPETAGEPDAATPATLAGDTDASGTGERASAVPDGAEDGADSGSDPIERLSEPGAAGDALDVSDVSLDDPQAVEVEDLAVDESDVGDGALGRRWTPRCRREPSHGGRSFSAGTAAGA